MIVTIAKVVDPARFLEIFETVGANKRREHGCRGARPISIPTTHTGCGPFSSRGRRGRAGRARGVRREPAGTGQLNYSDSGNFRRRFCSSMPEISSSLTAAQSVMTRPRSAPAC